MRALVVTNMWPTTRTPACGSFVRDQVTALRALDGVEVDVFAFEPGGGNPFGYIRAARALRRRDGGPYDVVHAHFGLTAWPALAARGRAHAVTLHGTDLVHPRSGPISRAALGRLDLSATVSAALAQLVPGAGTKRRVAVLPCGVATDRFRPLERAEVRERLGLAVDGRYVLFPSDPARPAKRFDLAQQVAGDAHLLVLKDVDPLDVPLWVNAANAVVMPSETEGFGLAVLEALACDVPVLAAPVGIHPLALDGVPGTLCAPFDVDRWRTALQPHLGAADPRVAGRARAELYSARRMAKRVAAAWADPGIYSEAAAPSSGALFT